MGTGQVWTDLVTSGYSRKLETRADKQGLQLLVAAGYEPTQSLPAFGALRIKEDDQVNVGKIWSSHPDIDSRLKNLKKQIKKIKSPPDHVPSEKSYVEAYGAALLVDAQLDLQRQRYQRAHATLQRYNSAIQDNPIGHYLAGEAYRKQYPEGPDYVSRIQAYQRAVSVDNEFAPAYKELGMAYRQQQRHKQAITALNNYLTFAPGAADVPIIRWYIEEMQDSSTAGRLEREQEITP